MKSSKAQLNDPHNISFASVAMSGSGHLKKDKQGISNSKFNIVSKSITTFNGKVDSVTYYI